VIDRLFIFDGINMMNGCGNYTEVGKPSFW